MGQALYRTHRPLKLSDVVGQEHITTALAHALKAGTISHAYLFTGPRGVGKTSIARILAHEINGLPYDDQSIHLDIIEIDAASNRRIDEIRDLRDKVHIAPTSAKYKVYIIDEVHMLTREAFNALLKTLEEPPAHAVFILATTEVHKLPETIISRTQRYAFKPVDLPKVVEHLQAIAKQEKIDIEPAALELIAAHGEGSFRDSISLLDQVRNSGNKVTLGDVQTSLGIAPETLVTSIVDALSAQDAVAVAQQLQQAREQGYEPSRLAKQIGANLRDHILENKTVLPPATIMQLLAKLLEVPASPDPRALLEIILLDAALAESETTAPSTPRTHAAAVHPAASSTIAEPAPARAATKAAAPKPEPAAAAPEPAQQKAPAAAKTEPAPESEQPPKPIKGGKTVEPAVWQEALNQIRQTYSTLYSILKSARAEFEPGLIRLSFTHAFHQKRAHDAKNREIVAQTVQKITGQAIQIECVVAEKPLAAQTIPAPPQEPKPATPPPTTAPPEPAPNPTEPAIDAISNIFGGAEVLES
ncbi:MAG TPA: DNA polymerase III subunit gamma/tau [Candidatus Saccharimonadales bacterium]|nr:DNA polymerase III subunit gamma/tau [Candidatus Saccharimonadales bacterium]